MDEGAKNIIMYHLRILRRGIVPAIGFIVLVTAFVLAYPWSMMLAVLLIVIWVFGILRQWVADEIEYYRNKG